MTNHGVTKKVLRLAQAGKTNTEMARILDVPYSTVTSAVQRLRLRGVLPPVKRNASLTAEYLRNHRLGPGFGSLQTALFPHTPDFAYWLAKQTPEGSTLADTLVAIALDAYNEAQDHGD